MRAQIVSFHCVLKNQVGKVISSTFNQDVITQSQDNNDFLQGLSEELKTLKKGEKRIVYLRADQAYGYYDPQLVIERERTGRAGRAWEGLKLGDEVLQNDPQGRPRIFHVTRSDSQTLTLDGNHPLAGQDLIFEIEATEARDATSAEIEESCSLDRIPGRTYH